MATEPDFTLTVTLSDDERWQVTEAREILARWYENHEDNTYGTDRTLADAGRGLLAIVDRLSGLGSESTD